MIEPYEKGTSFSHWVERLEFSFIANKVPDDNRKTYFIALCGPYIYAELKRLFPTGSLIEYPLSTMIEILKIRIDKSTADNHQHESFNPRMQKADESVRRELCSCGVFKNAPITDRLSVDLTRTDQTLEAVKSNVQNSTTNRSTLDQIALLVQSGDPVATAVEKLLSNYINNHRQANTQKHRITVKERLGFYPYSKNHLEQRNVTHVQPAPHLNPAVFKPEELQKDSRFCFFCGQQGHMLRKCFKLINLKRDALHLAEQMGTRNLEKQNMMELANRTGNEESDNDSDEGN